MTQVITKTQDPLTTRDRTIIATIVNSTPESIKTIWIEGGITTWVKFVDGGKLAFCRDWFKNRVQEVKATLPETPRERNDRLSEELQAACKKFKLWHGQIDWLSFSCKLFRDNELVGFVGFNEQGWYCRRRQYGPSQQVASAEGAIAQLGVRAAVA